MVNSGDDTERLRRGIFIEIAPSALLPRNDGDPVRLLRHSLRSFLAMTVVFALGEF